MLPGINLLGGNWDSANYPDKLALAIRNSDKVFTAWDGKTPVQAMLDHARKVLIAYDAEAGFYEYCGFEPGTGKTPMFVTYLKT